MATESQVKLAARMYEMRDTAKHLLRENYAPHMTKIGALLEGRAQKTGQSTLQVAMDAAKQAGAMDVIMIMAAVVEMSEPA